MFSIFVAFGEKNMARDLLNPRLQGREDGQRHWQQHGWTTFVGVRSIKVDSCCFLAPQYIEMSESLKSESSKFRSFLAVPKHFRDYQLRSLIHVWKISMRCSSNFGVPVSRWVPGGTQVSPEWSTPSHDWLAQVVNGIPSLLSEAHYVPELGVFLRCDDERSLDSLVW